MRVLFLLLAISTAVFAININKSLLQVHATLVPKISMMDYQFDEKIKDKTIKIAIMYKDAQYKDAKYLKQRIESRYRNGINSYKVKSQLVSYSDIKNTDANVYYLFPSNKQDIKNCVTQANNHQALTFSYLREDLKYGVMISLNVSKKIKPLLNLEAIKMSQITLRPVLLNISSIYMHEAGSAIESLQIRSFNIYTTEIA